MKEKYKGFTTFPIRLGSQILFMVNLFRHMNELGTKLMGKGTFDHEMYSLVKA